MPNISTDGVQEWTTTLYIDKTSQCGRADFTIPIRRGEALVHILHATIRDKDQDGLVTFDPGVNAVLCIPANPTQSIELESTITDSVVTCALPAAVSQIASSTNLAYFKFINETAHTIATTEAFTIKILPGAGEVDNIIDVNDFSPYFELKVATIAANEAAEAAAQAAIDATTAASDAATATTSATSAAEAATQAAEAAAIAAAEASAAGIAADTVNIEMDDAGVVTVTDKNDDTTTFEDLKAATAQADAIAQNLNATMDIDAVITVTDRDGETYVYDGIADAVAAANGITDNLDATITAQGVVVVTDREGVQHSYEGVKDAATQAGRLAAIVDDDGVVKVTNRDNTVTEYDVASQVSASIADPLQDVAAAATSASDAANNATARANDCLIATAAADAATTAAITATVQAVNATNNAAAATSATNTAISNAEDATSDATAAATAAWAAADTESWCVIDGTLYLGSSAYIDEQAGEIVMGRIYNV